MNFIFNFVPFLALKKSGGVIATCSSSRAKPMLDFLEGGGGEDFLEAGGGEDFLEGAGGEADGEME